MAGMSVLETDPMSLIDQGAQSPVEEHSMGQSELSSPSKATG